jgi:hypothetical protein
MKISLATVILGLAAATAVPGAAAKACDFDLINATSSPIGQLRLFNSADHYIGLGDPGPLLKGDKFRFSRRRIRSGGAAWPDSCDEKVYVDIIVGRPGDLTIDSFGGQQCHIKEQIKRPTNATFEVDNRHVVVITTRDLMHPGVCRDR